MKVILRQNVKNLGMTGDIVEVKPGYARNYLVPHRMAARLRLRADNRRQSVRLLRDDPAFHARALPRQP